MTIAIIAHDNKKAEMLSFVMKRLDFFKREDIAIMSTGTTGKLISDAGLTNVTCLKSGPLGGDAQIAAELVTKQIDLVLFFIDPLYSHPHEVDIHMLLRLCNVYDVPLATNYSTAKRLISYVKHNQYE